MNVSLIDRGASDSKKTLVFLYRKVTPEARNEGYDSLLHKNVGFNNPGNMGYLGSLLGIGNENHSNLVGLR